MAPGKEELKAKTYDWLLKEWQECDKLWSLFSCDCFGYYISALGSEISSRGGWPVK